MNAPTSVMDQRMEAERIYGWITDLCSQEGRLVAMLELSERRSQIESLGHLLWHSFGAVAGLLQEIVSIYPSVLTNDLTIQESQRICAAIGLFQAMASDPNIALLLIRCEFISYLMPMLKLTPQTRAVEHVRLSVLGVICGLLKSDQKEVVIYFLGTELMPHVLHNLEFGSSMSKVLCAFALFRILENEVGLSFVGNTMARKMHLVHTLARVVYQLTLEVEPRVLKHVVRAYFRLADHPQCIELILKHFPPQLRNGYFCKEKLPGYENANLELAKLSCKLANKEAQLKKGKEEIIS
ncbi:cell differentiation protein RCD1 homolog [Drosophila serrata]|uniref:cell differentiation protein RCD1 homolog n=1 Tax=Drosophila serrata TaxID=7274 RepID=UPI000A1D1062|nr:cell differentiation protein RCD1 homolog [Drosophila serrata]XP_020798498.1 cell differentiation protein RCD1 homolog [Drosophila serrata]